MTGFRQGQGKAHGAIFTVPCPVCAAAPHQPCIGADGEPTLVYADQHAVRLGLLLREWGFYGDPA